MTKKMPQEKTSAKIFDMFKGSAGSKKRHILANRSRIYCFPWRCLDCLGENIGKYIC